MSLTKGSLSGFWDLECNHCSEYEELEASDFSDAATQLAQMGWRYEGDGEHICPSCIEKEDDEMGKAL